MSRVPSPFDDPEVVAAYNTWQVANIIAMDADYFYSRSNLQALNEEAKNIVEQLWIIEEQALGNYCRLYDLWWVKQLEVTNG